MNVLTYVTQITLVIYINASLDQQFLNYKLLNLASGPFLMARSYSSYTVNSFRFHTSKRKRFKKSQNSGVLVQGDNNTEKVLRHSIRGIGVGIR